MMYRSSTEYTFACRRILEFMRCELAMCGCVLFHQQENEGFVEFVSGYIPGVSEGQSNQTLSSIASAVYTGRCATIVPDVARCAYRELADFQDFEPACIAAAVIPGIQENHYSILCGVSLSSSTVELAGRQSLMEFCAQQVEHAMSCYSKSKLDISAIEALTEQAYKDVMTGLLNRNGWETAIASTITSGFGLYRYVSVFVFDVDDLKILNDTQGHAAGDKAIRQVAMVLQQFFVRHDIAPFTDDEPLLARTGGDEFIGIQFGCDNEEAKKIISSIKDLLYSIGISVSIGSAFCRNVRLLSDAIANADKAMYSNKNQLKLVRSTQVIRYKPAS